MDSEHVEALLIAIGWLAVALVIRVASQRAFARWSSGKNPRDTARARTAYVMLVRLVLVLVLSVGAWTVLSTFEIPAALGGALLASSAVLAVFAGAALATPLGNLGSGVIVAFAQPVRIGDRVTVGDATGFVDDVGVVYTVLRTDDDRRVYVPNTQLTAASVINRSIDDPRRTVTASVPVRITAPLDQARSVVLEAVTGVPEAAQLHLTVTISEVSEKVVWLTVAALAPGGSNPTVLASDVREHALGALGRAGLLPV